MGKYNRQIIGFERYDHSTVNESNDATSLWVLIPEYRTIFCSDFYIRGSKHSIYASTGEVLLAATILHCLTQSKLLPKEVMLYQEATYAEWANGVDAIQIKLDITYADIDRDDDMQRIVNRL